jgi:hypothetical protein
MFTASHFSFLIWDREIRLQLHTACFLGSISLSWVPIFNINLVKAQVNFNYI